MKNLNADLKSGNFKQVYLLCGEEAYLKNRYKKRLREALVDAGDLMNFTSYTGKGIDVKQVIDQAETMPFFAERRLIQIEDSGFFKNACPELAEYLPTMPPETYMVFVESEVDKRGKLYKAVKASGRIVELGRQDEKTLTAWILSQMKKEGKSIRRDALDLFLEKTGDDMENIANELEKLLCYTAGKDGVEYTDVEEICTVTTENKIFDMIRAVAEKRQKQAMDLYYDLLSLKEPPMRILFLIARQFNQMLQLKDLIAQGYDSQTVASKAGIAPFIAKRSLAQAAKFELPVLQQAVEDCVEMEQAVKSGKLRHFFLIGGCDGARPGRNYYTEFAKKVPQDCIILTLACGKYRFNKLEFGEVASLPRLLDVGQCNDAYSAIRIATALADAFGTDVNGLPLSMILSWYEQKAVAVLLALLSLGVKGIYLGPTLPAFLSPNVLQYLVDTFDLRAVSNPEDDIKTCLKQNM